MENTAPGHTAPEATTTKKNLEGWLLGASGREGRFAGVPGNGCWAQGFGAGPGYHPPNSRALSGCRPQLTTRAGPWFSVWGDHASPRTHLPSCSFFLQPPSATSTATQQARSTLRNQEAKGRRTETSRSAKSRCRRSGENLCSVRSPTPMSSSTWMSSC